MALKKLPIAYFSQVAFPVIYQLLFTYFLLLAAVGQVFLQKALVIMAVIGVPLTAKLNFVLASRRRFRFFGWMPIQPFIATWVLPIAQLLILGIGI